MKYSAAVLLVLVAAVCLIGSSDAWGWQRGSSSRQRGRGNWTRGNSTRQNETFVLVRKVDEPHPYFRIMRLSTGNASLASLNASLADFFNKSAADVTMVVRNDKQLLATDMEAAKLKYKDQLEVTFKDSGAPTRSKTMYAYAKDARRQRWSDKSPKGQKKEDSKRDRPGRGRPNRDDRRRPAAPEADEADETMGEMEFF